MDEPGRVERGAHVALGMFFTAVILGVVFWPLWSRTALGAAADPIFAEGCHRIPGRCLHALGGGVGVMPLCARCLGVWAGVAIGAWLAASGAAGWRGWGRPLGWVLMGIATIDFFAGYHGLMPDGPAQRCLTGLLGGAGMYVWMERTRPCHVRQAIARLGRLARRHQPRFTLARAR